MYHPASTPSNALCGRYLSAPLCVLSTLMLAFCEPTWYSIWTNGFGLEAPEMAPLTFPTSLVQEQLLLPQDFCVFQNLSCLLSDRAF